ncbi:MAG: hypothetical protein SNJ53_08620, partial [Thermodesulfovibrionales bacterium]
MFADVLFPQNIKPLTYIIPQDISQEDLTGYIVSAPLKNKESFGIIVKTYDGDAVIPKYKSINKLYSRFADKTLISLILWASEYYLNNPGTALMSTPFKSLTTYMFKSKNKDKKSSEPSIQHSNDDTLCLNHNTDDSKLNKITQQISPKRYKTFYLRTGSMRHEMEFVLKLLKRINLSNVLILLPETIYLDLFFDRFYSEFGSRVGFLTSKMNTKEQGRVIKD